MLSICPHLDPALGGEVRIFVVHLLQHKEVAGFEELCWRTFCPPYQATEASSDRSTGSGGGQWLQVEQKARVNGAGEKFGRKSVTGAVGWFLERIPRPSGIDRFWNVL